MSQEHSIDACEEKLFKISRESYPYHNVNDSFGDV